MHAAMRREAHAQCTGRVRKGIKRVGSRLGVRSPALHLSHPRPVVEEAVREVETTVADKEVAMKMVARWAEARKVEVKAADAAFCETGSARLRRRR